MKHLVTKNRLLAGLPLSTRQLLLVNFERVELDFAAVLCESGDTIRHVYFPIDCFVSLVTALGAKERLEVGIVGSEGMLGMSLVLGVNVSPQHVLVQGAGVALRMNATRFRRFCAESAPLRQAMDRYIYVLMTQLAQTAACTHYHVVVARLARWLLLTRDRAHSDQFRLTHEFLAYMLGVRRVGITEAARQLHSRGLIRYHRGEVAILDGAGLEAASCRCYLQGNQMYERILGKRAGMQVGL